MSQPSEPVRSFQTPVRAPLWTIFRLGQTDVVVDPSWLLIFAFFIWTTSRSIIPNRLYDEAVKAGIAPTDTGVLVWVAGAVISLMFFASILAHEAAHAWTAVRSGIPTRRIRLFIFGGVAEIAREPERPRQEFVITIVGPLASALLAGLFLLLASALPPASIARVAVQWLGEINLALAVFNLMPGIPLDGGRLLRSAVWGVSGSLQLATRVASIAGSLLGAALIGFGVLSALSVLGPADTSIVGALWPILIGWFLLSAARSSYRDAVRRERLRGLTVRDILRADHEAAPSDGTVAELILRGMAAEPGAIRPVVNETGGLIGLVTGADAHRVPLARQTVTTLGDIARPREGLVVLDPERPLVEVLEEAARSGRRRFFVESDGLLVGWIDLVDVLAYLRPTPPPPA